MAQKLLTTFTLILFLLLAIGLLALTSSPDSASTGVINVQSIDKASFLAAAPVFLVLHKHKS